MLLPTDIYRLINKYAQESRLYVTIPSINIYECTFMCAFPITVSIQSRFDKYPNVTHMSMRYNLAIIPLQIRTLDICRAGIDHLPILPDTLTYLTCEYNSIVLIHRLPSRLRDLICSNNPLRGIFLFPPLIRYIRVENTRLEYLPNIPFSLEILQCSDNLVPTFPTTGKIRKSILINGKTVHDPRMQ